MLAESHGGSLGAVSCEQSQIALVVGRATSTRQNERGNEIMQDKSLAVQSHSAVTPWASRQDVRELGNRIKELLPGANKLRPHEALALSQAAVAHGLDPFNGELWYIPGRGLMAGIKGHRRAGHNQMEREGGGNYWCEFVGPMTIDELAAIKAPPAALAYKCRLYDSKNITTYVEAVSKLMTGGMPWDIVHSIMGDRPYTEGIGYYVSGEQTKMTPVQCAQKRAEADALKRRFDLPFSAAVGVNGDVDIVEGEFTIPLEPEQDLAEVQARMQSGSKALYGDKSDADLDTSEKTPGVAIPVRLGVWPAGVVTWAVQELGVKSQQVFGALNQSQHLPKDAPDETIKHWLQVRKTERDAGVEGQEATGRADADYLATHTA